MPPANDNIANRQAITGASGSGGPTTIDAATVEAGEPVGSALGSINKSVWFEWTAPNGNDVTFDTAGSLATDGNGDSHGGLDTTMTIWTGDPTDFTTLVEVASNDDVDGSHFTSEVTFTPVAGTTYLIQVGTYGSTYAGTVRLGWATFVPPTPPSNTDCASAAELVGCTGTVTGDNSLWAGTWPTGHDPLFNAQGVGGGAPLWWKWTNTRSRPMLFRYSITDAPANVYNAAIMADPVDGVCGSFVCQDGDLEGQNVEGGDTSGGWYHGSNFGTAFTSYFEEIVEPSDSIYIEIDSWAPGQTTEPPVAPSGHKGAFSFDWWAYEYTTYDSSQGNGAVFSDLLVSNFGPINDPSHNTIGQISPYATLVLGSRLYLLWADPADTYSETLYAGDCALDGTGLNTFKLRDGSVGPSFSHPEEQFGIGDFPRLFTDGTHVFVTYGCWIEPPTETDTVGTGYTSAPSYPNPDFPDSCAAHVGMQCFCFGEGGGTVVDTFRYDIWKFAGGGSWTKIKSIGEDHDKSVGFVPNASGSIIGEPDGANAIVIRSHAVGGVVWVQTTYRVVRGFQSFHFNDYPLFGCGPLVGSIYVTSDHVDVYEYQDTYTVDLVGTCTLVRRVENYLFELQHWVSDTPGNDPAFGNWQVFADGNWFTDPAGTHYPSIMYHPDACDMRCDEGYPIIAYTSQAYADNAGGSMGGGYTLNSVRLDRVDTAANLQDYTWNDLQAGAGLTNVTDAWCNILTLSPRFQDPNDSLYKRVLGTNWLGDVAAVSWADKIPSDVSGAPEWIVPGQSLSSRIAPPATVFPDITKLQWYSVDFSTDGHSGIELTSLYEHCNERWDSAYLSSTNGDGLPGSPGNRWSMNPAVGWQFSDVSHSYVWVINVENQLRRVNLLRDYYICDIGQPCSPGLLSWHIF